LRKNAHAKSSHEQKLLASGEERSDLAFPGDLSGAIGIEIPSYEENIEFSVQERCPLI
jgi:hypothetical protein